MEYSRERAAHDAKEDARYDECDARHQHEEQHGTSAANRGRLTWRRRAFVDGTHGAKRADTNAKREADASEEHSYEIGTR